MKNSEKQLVGVGILAAGIYVVFSFGLPQWDAFSTNNAQSASLQSDLKASQSEKDALNLQISLLEKNIDIPAGIQVKTFTNDTEEQATKELLDHVVNLATGSGNKFVSLNPVTVEPFLAPKVAKPADPNADPSTQLATPSAAGAAVVAAAAAASAPAPGSEEEQAAALARAQDSLPPLVTKGYELTIRGTYNSLQSFLRAMDKQVLVMDMLDFDLENEAAGGDATAGASNGGTTVGDPSYPLSLKIKLRLALQRVEVTK